MRNSAIFCQQGVLQPPPALTRCEKLMVNCDKLPFIWQIWVLNSPATPIFGYCQVWRHRVNKPAWQSDYDLNNKTESAENRRLVCLLFQQQCGHMAAAPFERCRYSQLDGDGNSCESAFSGAWKTSPEWLVVTPGACFGDALLWP